MSRRSKREYLEAIKPRYQKASKKEKSKILDEFRQNCGYNRKYAIRVLNQGYQRLMESGYIDNRTKQKLTIIFKQLNPYGLQKRIRRKIKRIQEVAASNDPTFTIFA